MTTFWIFIVIVVLVSLALIWIPHFRQKKLLQAGETGVRQQTNLELFNERLAALEKELNDKVLEQHEFDSLKKELEISLLQDIKQGQDESLDVQGKPKSILWPSIMSVAVIVFAGFMYQRLGAYQEMENTAAATPANPHAGMTPEQLMKLRVQMLEKQVAAEPDNSQAWFDLGHAYMQAGQFDESVAAFDKVIGLVGEHAELLGPKATALYYKAGQKMIPIVQQLIKRSLEMDPHDPSTLLLVGMDAFYTADYQKAIDSWNKILESNRTDIDRQAIISAIDSAKMRLQANDGSMPNDANHAKFRKDAAGAESSAKTVTVKLSVSPELASKVSDSDVIFVFARPTEGPSVPVAATKVSAKALPLTVVLDDTTNMGGSVTLSQAKNVEVIAVLSKHGNLKPEAGDLRGKLASIDVGASGALVLDSEVQ